MISEVTSNRYHYHSVVQRATAKATAGQGTGTEQAELSHKQPVQQLQCCPIVVLENLQDPNISSMFGAKADSHEKQ